MSEKNIRILLQQYAAGSISDEDRHYLEKKALVDPFLFEALEGFSNSSKPDSKSIYQKNRFWKFLLLLTFFIAIIIVIYFISSTDKSLFKKESLLPSETFIELNITPRNDSVAPDTIRPINIKDSTKQLESKIIPIEFASKKVEPDPKFVRYTQALPRLNKSIDLQLSELPLTYKPDLHMTIPDIASQDSGMTLDDSIILAENNDALIRLDELVITDFNTIQSKQVIGYAAVETIDADEMSLNLDIEDFVIPTISGYVIDAEQEPLIGANVVCDGTRHGTITDIDGYFSLVKNEDCKDLIISFTGYTSLTIEADASHTLDIQLYESELLAEVVVTAYGSEDNTNYKKPRQFNHAVPLIGKDSLIQIIKMEFENSECKYSGNIRSEFVFKKNGEIGIILITNKVPRKCKKAFKKAIRSSIWITDDSTKKTWVHYHFIP